MNVKIRAFRAIDDEETCRRYFQGHKQVLEDHGFTHLKTNTENWFYNPNVIVLVAENMETGELVGGVRLEKATRDYELPTVKALKKIDPKIIPFVEKYIDDGIAEGCGLWNAKSVSGKRVSVLLVRAATAVSTQIEITRLLAFLAKYTSYIILRMGFLRQTSLGFNGDYHYPNEYFIANVYLNEYIEDLRFARPEDRNKMMALRENLNLQIIEHEADAPIMVHYDLKIIK